MAHFYNTIDQQMIPSQRPMMLSYALAFEQVIKVRPTMQKAMSHHVFTEGAVASAKQLANM